MLEPREQPGEATTQLLPGGSGFRREPEARPLRPLEERVVEASSTRGEDVLPAFAVHSLGPDVVVSRTDELIDGREWRDREIARHRDEHVPPRELPSAREP